MKRVADKRYAGLNMVYLFSLTAKLIPAENLLAFIQQTVVRLSQALQELIEDPASLVLLARVVGLLLGGMASTMGHRKYIFMGMTEGNVQREEAYKSTFTITVHISNAFI